MRLRLVGIDGDNIEVEHSGRHGTIDKAYIDKKKVKELQEFGVAYTNKDKSLVVWSS